MHRRAFGLRPVPPLSSRPFGFNPSLLRAGGAARVAWRPSNPTEPDTPERPGQRSAAMGGALANTLALAAAGSADACRPRRWRFSSIASRRMVHGHTARPRYETSTPRFKIGIARCGRGFLVSRWSVDLARVRERVGEAFVRVCRIGHNSFRSGSAQGVLVSL